MPIVKIAAKTEYIVRWIRQRKFLYKAIDDELVVYEKILKAYRSQLSRKFRFLQMVQLDGIGLITINSVSQKSASIKLQPALEFSSKFTLKTAHATLFLLKPAHLNDESQSHEKIHNTIANKLLLQEHTISKCLQNYIKAALQIGLNDPKRKVYIQLGPFEIELYQRIATLKCRVPCKNETPNNQYPYQKFYDKTMEQIYEKRWNESIIGCLNENLNIKDLKQNLDRGQIATINYFSYMKSHQQHKY